MTRIGVWLGALAPLLLALGAPLRAGDETKSFDARVEVRVWSPWPESVQKGWAPIYLELRNDEPEDRTIRLQARCNDYGSERTVKTTLRLASGTHTEMELLVPLGGVYFNQYAVQLSGPDGNLWFMGVVGSNSKQPLLRQVLQLSQSQPAAGDVERWSAALSDSVLEESESIGYGRVLATTAAPNNVDVAHAGYEDMAAQHAAYSSLDLVVLEPADEMPSEARLAPLIAWVRTGGDVLVLGPRARTQCLAVPALAAWMEARFEVGYGEESQYRCGLGRLFVADAADGLEEHADWIRSILDANAGTTPEELEWRGKSVLPAIPDLPRLPHRIFAVLLILFALVIGPLNFVAVRKRKNPALLLVTIPIIALVTTLALLAYGIFFQGIDVKSASVSVAVLDQREHRSACLEARQFFCGISPADGLRLGPGTIVHTAGDENGGNRLRYEVSLDGGTLLGGEYLPSRRETEQVLLVERSERARLDVQREGERLSIDNNLGVEILELVLRDPEGGFHTLAQPLSAGAHAGLEAAGELEATSLRIERMLESVPPPSAVPPALVRDNIPPGCFLARLGTSPFRDDCGIEMNERFGAHVVLGVLALDSEAWR